MGAMVYLKVQPYAQSSVMPCVNQKLSFMYFGPFEVLERVGTVAYHLKLPDSAAIHLVVHVSQLKLAARFKGSVSSQLPFASVVYRLPLKILDYCMVSRGGAQVAQLFIQWTELPPDWATWEDCDALKQLFLGAPGWGQAAIQEGENVSIADGLNQNDTSPRQSSRSRKLNSDVTGPMWH
jgi:hypothetical protein